MTFGTNSETWPLYHALIVGDLDKFSQLYEKHLAQHGEKKIPDDGFPYSWLERALTLTDRHLPIAEAIIDKQEKKIKSNSALLHRLMYIYFSRFSPVERKNLVLYTHGTFTGVCYPSTVLFLKNTMMKSEINFDDLLKLFKRKSLSKLKNIDTKPYRLLSKKDRLLKIFLDESMLLLSSIFNQYTLSGNFTYSDFSELFLRMHPEFNIIKSTASDISNQFMIFVSNRLLGLVDMHRVNLEITHFGFNFIRKSQLSSIIDINHPDTPLLVPSTNQSINYLFVVSNHVVGLRIDAEKNIQFFDINHPEITVDEYDKIKSWLANTHFDIEESKIIPIHIIRVVQSNQDFMPEEEYHRQQQQFDQSLLALWSNTTSGMLKNSMTQEICLNYLLSSIVCGAKIPDAVKQDLFRYVPKTTYDELSAFSNKHMVGNLSRLHHANAVKYPVRLPGPKNGNQVLLTSYFSMIVFTIIAIVVAKIFLNKTTTIAKKPNPLPHDQNQPTRRQRNKHRLAT